MAVRPRSTSAGAPPQEVASRPGWLDEEAPLGRSAWAALRRLARRASASWPVWIGLALFLSASLTYRRAKAPPIAEMTMVLRVTEGTSMRSTGAELGPGALRAYINDLAFTSSRLIDLMQHQPKAFPDVAKDPKAALINLWGQMNISISDGTFIEDRGPDDPPRSARIEIIYHSSSPQLAAMMVQQLADLLIRSTLAGQRAGLEERLATAGVAVGRAEAEIADLSHADPTDLDPRLGAARERWRSADEEQEAARLSLRAASEHEALRFEVIDPGHLTVQIATTNALVTDFLLTLLTALVVAGILVPAFDPRVIEAANLTSLGVAFLGSIPALPTSHGHQGRKGGTSSPRV